MAGIDARAVEQARRENTIRLMTALRLQERQESREEIAAHIYQYKGRAMSGGASLLCPGDYMMTGGNGEFLISARGARVDLGFDGLEKLVNAGALDHVLDAADINSPAFEARLDEILDKMAAQAEYRDAYKCCLCGHSHGYAIAAFAEDIADNTPTAVIVRSGSEFAAAAGRSLGDDLKDIVKDAAGSASPFRECSYEEFNPGIRDIRQALEDGVNGERENAGARFEKMRDEIVSAGSAGKDKPEPKRDDPDDPDKGGAEREPSAYDKLKAAAEEQERTQAECAAQAEEDGEDLSALESSRAMRMFR